MPVPISSCGVLLYELLSGHRAFEGATSADTLGAILAKDPPEVPSTSERRVPPGLQRIVSRCMEKDPAARFQSAADLAFALGALSTESGAAFAEGRMDNRSAARGRWRPAALGFAAGVALVASLGTWFRPTPSSAPTLPVAQFDVPLSLASGTQTLTVSRVRVSVDGGVQPLWRADQRELFFLAPDGQMMAASLNATASRTTVGAPAALFQSPLNPNFATEQYAVTQDGQRFLLRVPAEEATGLRVIMNWPGLLARPSLPDGR